MKKLISVILAVVMIFSVTSILAFAADDAETYQITFADLPYDIADFRDDFVADYMGYKYGTDYWFTVTNNKNGNITIDGVDHPVSAGTTTELKGAPVSITVTKGDTLEFTVCVADYIEPQTVRVIAFPTGTDVNELADLDELSTDLTVNPGEPYEQYYLAKSNVGTYGISPDKDLTICVSEYHLYNDCFLYDFPTSDFYTANRVIFRGETLDDIDSPDSYETVEWGNTKVIYDNETLFFEVRMDLNSEYDLHYDTYDVYYMIDDLGFGDIVSELSGAEKVYLEPIYTYYDVDEEAGTEEQVDIYAIENVKYGTIIKVTNTVTYTIDMLAQLISDFDLENLSNLDLSSVDLSPMLELVMRLANLIVKMLNAFGMNVSLGDILG